MLLRSRPAVSIVMSTDVRLTLTPPARTTGRIVKMRSVRHGRDELPTLSRRGPRAESITRLTVSVT